MLVWLSALPIDPCLYPVYFDEEEIRHWNIGKNPLPHYSEINAIHIFKKCFAAESFQM